MLDNDLSLKQHLSQIEMNDIAFWIYESLHNIKTTYENCWNAFYKFLSDTLSQSNEDSMIIAENDDNESKELENIGDIINTETPFTT